MPKNSALFAVCFVAGQLGAIAAGLLLWASGEWGISNLLNVKVGPPLTQAWFYPQMMLGGLWGLGYFFTVAVPRQRKHWIRKGLWFSLLPTAVTLFYIYPYVKHYGIAGFNLGALTPLLILTSNLVWGLFTGFFTRLFWGR